MARKRSPIVTKALHFIAVNMTPMAKVKRPIARRLLLLKRTKRPFNLLRHYNYAFIAEREFSPSTSPLFAHCRAPPRKRSRFLSLLCGGDGAESVADGGVFEDELEMLSPEDDDLDGVDRILQPHLLLEYGDGDGDGDEEDATVDQRAERFIEKFYEEMRIQSQNSDAALEFVL